MKRVWFILAATFGALGPAAAASLAPGQAVLGTKHTLACYIERSKELYVSTASPPALGIGTVVHFTAALDVNGAAYSSSAPAQAGIPVHVFTPMDNVARMFRPGAPCTAYWVSPPVVHD